MFELSVNFPTNITFQKVWIKNVTSILRNTKVRIESLNQLIRVYEDISLPLRRAKVVGIGLNTFGLDEIQTNDAIKKTEDETGLPTCDVIKQGSERLLKECLK